MIPNAARPTGRRLPTAQLLLRRLTIAAVIALALVPAGDAKNVRRPLGQAALASLTLEARNVSPAAPGPFLASTENVGKRGDECRQVHNAQDKCAFIREQCQNEQVGVFNYLDLYYCRFPNAPVVGFLIMVAWLGTLFTTIGIAASDFFCINLSTIASVLGMSESMAGVTFLAFGNGSPDVFSTFAAMKIDSGSLAVGELIGAASFIVAVVAGSMAIVRPFKVAKRSFVRDVSFFVVAILFGIFVLADGEIHMWECIVMVMYYVCYVLFVVAWHWYTTRRRRIRLKESHARDQYVAPGEEEAGTYVDDDEDGGVNSETTDLLAPDIRLLESPDNDDETTTEEEEQQGYAELSNSMRITRPGGYPANTPHSIRPSLVGAMEFRSVMSSLKKTQNLHGRPIHLRRYSDQPLLSALPERFSAPGTLMSNTPIGSFHESTPFLPPPTRPMGLSAQRVRAVSVNDLGGNYTQNHFNTMPPANYASLQPFLHEHGGVVRGTGLTLAVPSSDFLSVPGSGAVSTAGSSPISPSSQYNQDGYFASPLMLADGEMYTDGNGRASPAFLQLPPANHNSMPDSETLRERLLGDTESGQTLAAEQIKWRVFKYWPYDYLPPPQLLWAKLFPTLQGFWDKTALDKLMALTAVPSVFILTITLPVVEDCHDSEPDPKIPPTSADAATPLLIDAEPQVLPLRMDAENSPPVDPQAKAPSGWNRWLLAVQCIFAPVFVALVLFGEFDNLLHYILWALLIGLVSLFFLLTLTNPTTQPRHAHLLCYVGFIVAISWISTIANEVVGVLKALGIIFSISDAILGLTIFAVGNSLGDLVADITIAKLGYPVMALSACFGGPMLNILLGVGVSGIYIAMTRDGQAYRVEVSSTLVISAATLLVTLVFLLVCVPLNAWKMDRRIGWTMIALWGVSTAVNLVVEGAGGGKSWGDI
ncbi:sodium/calcium exchanger protein [Peziza echinospora]|nr:sodium/calcium exchanger protein [Peziza echinospora]